MTKINNILELITAVFEEKTIFYLKDNNKTILAFDTTPKEYSFPVLDKSFRMELELGCHGTIKDFMKLNAFIKYMQMCSTWVTRDEEEYVFPNLRDLYYE